MTAKNEYGLTPQQEVFAQGVASGSSLADAYRKAYPRSTKWKYAAVYARSSELMAKGVVSVRVEALREAAASASAVSAEKLVREMARVAFSDPRKLVHPGGKLKTLEELDDDTAAALAAVEVDEYGKVKYKFWDKGAAQEKLAKYLGLYEKDNSQKTDPLAELVRAITGTVVGPRGIDFGGE